MIREDEDVLDFLDSKVVSQITSTSQSRKQKHGSRSDGGSKADFETDEDGRMRVNESEDDQEVQAVEGAKPSEDFYKQSLTNEAAFVRLPDGRIKFLNNKRKLGDRDADEESEGQEAGSRWGKKFGSEKNHKNGGLDEAAKAKMLGKQYKAKVRQAFPPSFLELLLYLPLLFLYIQRAKGDVKKAGMPDPYAYIPLSGKIVGNKKKSAEISSGLKDIIKATRNGSEVPARKKGGPHKPGLNKSNKKHK
jgi:ribosomal RNA-processing protein 12